MSIILTALAAAFAAFCVWLTVRIVNRRERWAKRTLAAVVGVPVLYVESFGPACGLVQRNMLPPALLTSVYTPLVDAARPRAALSPLLWDFARLFGGRLALF